MRGLPVHANDGIFAGGAAHSAVQAVGRCDAPVGQQGSLTRGQGFDATDAAVSAVVISAAAGVGGALELADAQRILQFERLGGGC